MKPQLILISHGHYAYELYQSAKMIIGEIENLHTISMLEDDGLEGTQNKLNAVISKIGEETPVVIVVDILSGTPCNVAVQLMYQRENVRVVTGLNLLMAVEYAVTNIKDVDELAKLMFEVGLASVKLVEKPSEVNIEGEGYED